MPKKGAAGKDKKNNQLWTTLPLGVRFQLDQLVEKKVEGDSHSEIIRAMVIAQLKKMRAQYDLKLPTALDLERLDAELKAATRRRAARRGAANSPSIGAKPDNTTPR